jgi:hypothetical protein
MQLPFPSISKTNQQYATNPPAYPNQKEDSDEEARMTAAGVACVCLLIFLIIAIAISFGTRGYYETHDQHYDHHGHYNSDYAQWGR